MKRGLWIICLAVLPWCISCVDVEDEPAPQACGMEDLEFTPINQLQVIASHNSYRKRTYAPLFNLLSLGTAILPDEWIPDQVDPTVQWDYHHEPLPVQFNQHNVRSIELDLYNDPEGGLYANRLLKALVGEPIQSNLPLLSQPGIKVMHIAHMDWETHYLTFRQSLEAVLRWSENHPGHFPIYILMELKDRSFPFEIPGLVQPFNSNNAYRIADEILDVIPREKLITPEDMRTEATLNASIQANGWPPLAEARGKLFFVAMGFHEISGVVFGSNSSLVNHDNYIFKVINSPERDFEEIQQMVDAGYMVRTRADAGTLEARSGDTTPRDLAFASKAQIISTDYYRPDYRFIIFPNDWTDYCVQWPGGNVARSNQDFDCFLPN